MLRLLHARSALATRGTTGALCPGRASYARALDCDGHGFVAQRPGVDRLLRLPVQNRGRFQASPAYAGHLCLPLLDDDHDTDLAAFWQSVHASQIQTVARSRTP
jgi:hypothetical protein